jgi:phosphatidylserine/phosphatidylglycerophosphate/cardiolipin synthase-like enzyme
MAGPFLRADPGLRLEGAAAGTRIEHLVGGEVALPRMLADIRAAAANHRDAFVYLAGWNCENDLPVPTAAGPTDNLGEALRFAAGRDAQIRLLLWAGALDQTTLRRLPARIQKILLDLAAQWSPTRAHNLATEALLKKLRADGHDAWCHIDDAHLFAGSHHQKLLIVGTKESFVAYVGGIEFSTDRLYATDAAGKRLPGAPLFDVTLRVSGPGADSLLRTFTDRWSATVPPPAVPLAPLPALRGLGAPPSTAAGPLTSQATHTYAPGFPYRAKIQTSARAIASAIRSAKQYFYMEDQYYSGTEELTNAIKDALRANKDVWGVVVIANEGSVGDLPDLAYRRRQMLTPLVAAFPGRFYVFERKGDDGTNTGRTAYVHSKLTIVDDVTAVVGSVNSSYRSWTHDTEVMLTVHDPRGPGPTTPADWRPIRRLRADIWHRHLGAPPAVLGDPAALRRWWLEVWIRARTAHVAPSAVFVPAKPAFGPLSDWVWTNFLDPRVP